MKQFNDVLSQIKDDITEKNKQSTALKDFALVQNFEEERSKNGKDYDQRNHLYSELLEKYILSYESKAKCNRIYKMIFFIVSLVVFFGIIFSSFICLFIVVNKSNSSLADISVVGGAIASVISSIIILPKIIAEHLFPTNEDENMIDMVKNMQVNDSRIRNSNLKHKKSSSQKH